MRLRRDAVGGVAGLLSMLTLWGCSHNVDQHPVFVGETDAGREFEIIWFREGFGGIGLEWQTRGRGLLHDRLDILWFANTGNTTRQPVGRDTLVRHDAGSRYVGKFEVRNSEDRVWLVDSGTQIVLAAADFEVPEVHAAGGEMPEWASSALGRLLSSDACDE